MTLASAFLLEDKYKARKPNRFILSPFMANFKKDEMTIIERNYVKILLFISIGFFIISCREYTTNPNLIVNSNDIKIEISNYGCLGNSKQNIHIKKIKGERIMINNYFNGIYEPERTMSFDSQKEQILCNLIRVGQSMRDSLYCTGSSIYKIETERYICDFEVNSCRLEKYLTELMK